RYQSADEMEADLERVARGLPVAATTAESATQVLRRPAPAPADATVVAPARGRAAVPPPPVVEEERAEAAPGRERPLWPWLVALLFVVAAAVAGFFVWRDLSGSTPQVPVGLYQGEPVAQAKRQIVAAHLQATVKPAPSERYRPGIVSAQAPQAGSHLARGDTVTIWVSTGPPKVAVPTVKGQTWPQAQQALRAKGLKPVERIVPGATKGEVTATEPPAGTRVAKGSTVRVNVMSGPVKASVPNVVGQSLSQAIAALHADGFNVNVAGTVNSTQPQNTVVSQRPQPGASIPKGSTVNITLSNGPPQVQVPDVVTYTSQYAVQVLEKAGFKVDQQYQTVTDPTQDNIVQSQNPQGGTRAAQGSTVTITIGQYSSGPPPTGTTTTTG
ncbi:MAG TPA: PASTA domain-containing protein, partial [Acidimicrobiales bacterium]|nr:PASTA domain-containing protein [Acidimicrobiales bacterium]